MRFKNTWLDYYQKIGAPLPNQAQSPFPLTRKSDSCSWAGLFSSRFASLSMDFDSKSGFME